MLGDTAEKSMNPLKKAMRRRHGKTVTFGGLNYVEASDYEYSSDEEDEDAPAKAQVQQAAATNGTAAAANGAQTQEQTAQAAGRRSVSPVTKVEDPADRRKTVEGVRPDPLALEAEKKSPSPTGPRESNERESDERPRRLKDGTVRDSFFKDEVAETRKITLTPNILRDDNGNGGVKLDMKKNFDAIDKEIAKGKEDKKKEKNKKPGMLSGLFKKKEKSKKGSDVSIDTAIAQELSRGSPASDLESPVEATHNQFLGRKTSNSKLQKPNPPTLAPQSMTTQQIVQEPSIITTAIEAQRSTEPEKAAPTSNIERPTLLTKAIDNSSEFIDRIRSPSEGPKREKVRPIKTREALEVDSTPEDERDTDPFADPDENPMAIAGGQIVDAAALHDPEIMETEAHSLESEPPALVGDNSSQTSSDELASLRNSPEPPRSLSVGVARQDSDTLNLSMAHARAPSAENPPAPTRAAPSQPFTASPVTMHGFVPTTTTMQRSPPTAHTPSLRNDSISTENSLHTVPSYSSHYTSASHHTSHTTPQTPSTVHTSTMWSDSSLKNWLEASGQDEIRDLLIVVNDTSGVQPVGPEHEMIRGLFGEERGKVAELNSELDGLLGTWMQKRRARLSGGSVNQ